MLTDECRSLNADRSLSTSAAGTDPIAPGKQRGGTLSLSPKSAITPHLAVKRPLRVALSLLLCVIPAVSQKTPPPPASPKYDSQTELKTKGTIEEVNTLTVGSRKDYTEVILKSGDDKIHIYISPKPFQDEMGITFAKGDEIAVTGSKVKQEASDVILAREVVRGTDTLLFRDGKGKPVWDERTGK
jgi:hypothetical protein